MKILIIGANGNIGKIITPALQQKHEVITAGRNSGDVSADISSIASLENLFAQIGTVDAVVCAAGDSVTSDLPSMTDEKYFTGVQQKLLAQINLVITGLKHIHDHGSFTLISGKMGENPAKGSSGKAVANGAVNSFVLAAALEMPRGIRINVISPSKITDIAAEDLIKGYLKSIATSANGEIIRIGYH
ncbi:short chain dehydrogenase [Olivibacter sp. SDN3]|uniref:short chain dehydrogenase n=1 Tax=Olivibacter sp. SDN3 TaxID=2764720 RepID=UPI00165197DC|nr:short chain dehydrogenase [Olivibacter sp. SDN3]QNL49174.1 short chain dehydrogenase [Olivibacter sp. SDN3]